MVGIVNEWVVVISSASTSVGALITWLYLRRYEKKRAISAVRKETKVNNVDGDTALINQLDLLLKKVTELSDMLTQIQAELAAEKNTNQSWKSAFFRMKLKCDEICKDSALCKRHIIQILTDLNLHDDNDTKEDTGN